MPSEPRWVTADEAIQLNRWTVEMTAEPYQLRDAGLLESALASPVNHYHHGEQSLARLAAALLLAVARNHPFAQGNKRTALHVAKAFLNLNRARLQYPDETLADLILGAITREIDEATFIRRFAEAVVVPRPAPRRRSVARQMVRDSRTGRYRPE